MCSKSSIIGLGQKFNGHPMDITSLSFYFRVLSLSRDSSCVDRGVGGVK